MRKYKSFLIIALCILFAASNAFADSAWYKKGYDQGYREGETQARVDGFQKGKTDGERKGRTDGDREGYAEGKRRGEEAGKKEGFANGLRSGRFDGEHDGITRGERDGKQRCYNEGHSTGYNRGYSEGYEAGLNSDAYSKGFISGKEKASDVEWEKGFRAGYNKSYNETEKQIKSQVLSQNGFGLSSRNTPSVVEFETRNEEIENRMTEEEKQDFEKGKKAGYSAGYKAKYNQYYRQAYDTEYRNAYEKARKTAYDRGYRAGFNTGKDEGYRQGYRQGYDEAYRVNYDMYYRREYAFDRNRGYNDGFGKGEKAGYDKAYNLKYDEGYEKGYEETALQVYPQAFNKGIIDGETDCRKYFAGNAVLEILRVNYVSANEDEFFVAGHEFGIELILVNYGDKIAENIVVTNSVITGEIEAENLNIEVVNGRKVLKVTQICGLIKEEAEMNSKVIVDVSLKFNNKNVSSKMVSFMIKNYNSENYIALTKAAGFIEEAVARLQTTDSSVKARLENVKNEIVSICETDNLDTNAEVKKMALKACSNLENLYNVIPNEIRFAVKSAMRLLERNVN
ncbi:MAG: hypothetical protein WC002_06475 [Candidatus Muiribacteriota bacterium]